MSDQPIGKDHPPTDDDLRAVNMLAGELPQAGEEGATLVIHFTSGQRMAQWVQEVRQALHLEDRFQVYRLRAEDVGDLTTTTTYVPGYFIISEPNTRPDNERAVIITRRYV